MGSKPVSTGRARQGVWLGREHSFIHASRAKSIRRQVCRGITVRDNRERLKRSGMVDLLGMFRRRPAKRGPAGFARSRDDITALGDSFGNMLTSPVRNAPPMARTAPLPGLEVARSPQPAVEPPRQERPRPQAQALRTQTPKTNGAAAPRLIKRPGYLA